MWKKLFFLAFAFIILTGVTNVHATVITLNDGECFDVQGNATVGCGSATADFQCVGLVPVPFTPPYLFGVNDVSLTTPKVANAIGLLWDQSRHKINSGDTVLVKLNDGNWSRITSTNAQNGDCQFNDIGTSGSAINNTPFFDGNKYASFDSATLQVNDTISVAFDWRDLGYYFYNNTFEFIPALPYGFNQTQIDVYNSHVTMNNQAQRSQIATCNSNGNNIDITGACDVNPVDDTTPASKERLQILQCNNPSILSINTTSNNTLLNVFGYQYTCEYPLMNIGGVNLTNAFVLNESRTDLGDPSNVRKDFRIHMAYYDIQNFNIISGVTHSPLNPQADNNVTFSWLTTLPSDSTVFFRYKPLGTDDNNYTSFFTLSNGTDVTTHYLILNNENIIDANFYQYYVQSNEVIDNNTDVYYNFTVGSIGGGGIEVTGTIPTALDNIENTGFCAGSSCAWYFGLIIIGVFTLLGWHFGNAMVGKSVFVTLVVILGIFNVIPMVILVPLIVISALIIARMFGWLGGS